ADVQLGDATATSLTRTDGRPSLGLTVTLAPEGSASSVSDEITGMMSDLEGKLGNDAQLTVVFDQGPMVSDSIQSLLEEGLLGLVMAVLVIVVFLRSARSTLVTAVSIPLSLVIALISLKLFDYSLNMLTLGALTIAVGRVVDDSIVVLENIKRHLGYGEERSAAIMSGVREVAGAVTSSTLTTVAVFLPIALVGDIVGQLFRPFSIAVTVAMMASLVVSLTIIPILAYWFLKPPATGDDPEAFRRKVEEEERNGFLQRTYVPVIGFATKFRKSVLAGAVVILIGTFALAGGLKTAFIGEQDTPSLTVSQELAPGTSLATTDAAAKRAEQIIDSIDGVDSYQVTAGSQGPFSMGGAETASYTVVLEEGSDADAISETLKTRLNGLSGAGEFTVASSDGTGFSSDIQVQEAAADDEVRVTAARQVEQ
ncbi:efflux RND transporter permease subunit, partial [Actinomadura adrarensis]